MLIADTLVHEWPDEKDLAHIAIKGAEVARMLAPDGTFLTHYWPFGVRETDVLGKYILRYLTQLGADPRGGITWEKLDRAGWATGRTQNEGDDA